MIKAARQAGVHINASCGGSGVCGKCRILVESGRLAEGRGTKMSEAEYAEGLRQACLAKIESDCVVRIPADSELKGGSLATEVPVRNRARMHLFDIDSAKEEGIFAPPVEKLFVELPRASAADNMADAGRVIQGLKNQYDEKPADHSPHRAAQTPEDYTRGRFPGHRHPGPAGQRQRQEHRRQHPARQLGTRNFGLAFDIGTTTVYGNLVDLQSGKVLASGGDYNGQLGYGEDVISRIIYAEKPKGLELMHELVIGTINAITNRLLQKAGVGRDEISSITLAGNTTMTHFLLGLEPHNIRRAPYVPVSTFLPPIRANDLDLQFG